MSKPYVCYVAEVEIGDYSGEFATKRLQRGSYKWLLEAVQELVDRGGELFFAHKITINKEKGKQREEAVESITGRIKDDIRHGDNRRRDGDERIPLRFAGEGAV